MDCSINDQIMQRRFSVDVGVHTSDFLLILMLSKGRAYSCRLVCLSVLPSEAISPQRLDQMDQTSYINSLEYCADLLFWDFEFDALSWKKEASCKILIFS